VGAVKLLATPLSGLQIVETEPVSDARGSFERLFCRQEWSPLRAGLDFVQINLSTTAMRGTVRGLHYQRPPTTEAKLIRCTRGAVFDVAVDVREGSPTFLHWHAITLRADEPREVFIPEGFAHGFQSLTEDAQLLYFHTAAWAREHEGGLRHDDPRLGIDWPLPVAQLSERDRVHPLIDDSFTGISR
jgi:dTDP-4-dehydrorhamnose 3,5-epimerase